MTSRLKVLAAVAVAATGIVTRMATGKAIRKPQNGWKGAYLVEFGQRVVEPPEVVAMERWCRRVVAPQQPADIRARSAGSNRARREEHIAERITVVR